METHIMFTNVLYAVIGIFLMAGAYKFFDWMTPDIHFANQLKSGNIAVAIFIGSIFIGIALIISHSLN